MLGYFRGTQGTICLTAFRGLLSLLPILRLRALTRNVAHYSDVSQLVSHTESWHSISGRASFRYYRDALFAASPRLCLECYSCVAATGATDHQCDPVNREIAVTFDEWVEEMEAEDLAEEAEALAAEEALHQADLDRAADAARNMLDIEHVLNTGEEAVTILSGL